MWDDEPAPWDTDEPAPAADGAAAEGGTGEAAPAEEKPPMDYSKLDKAPKPEYNQHWVRPLFLNYDYLYDYRLNYYDDVIDYLDKRQKGLYRETPRAQEWAERALRTYIGKIALKSGKRSADMRMLSGLRAAQNSRYYSYHTRAYYSLKYQKIL